MRRNETVYLDEYGNESYAPSIGRMVWRALWVIPLAFGALWFLKAAWPASFLFYGGIFLMRHVHYSLNGY